MYIVNIAYVIMLFIGIALCFEGIQWYRIFQMIVSAVVFGYIGVIIQQLSKSNNMFFIVPVFAIIGIAFCVKFYEWSLRVTSSCLTFYFIIQNYWHKAYDMYSESKEDFLGIKETFKTLSEMDTPSDLLPFFNDIISIRFDNIKNVFTQAADIMRTGLFVAIVVAIIVGVVVVKIHDYVVIIITSALGAMFITNVAENYIPVVSDWYIIIMAAILLIGFIWQFKLKLSNKKKD